MRLRSTSFKQREGLRKAGRKARPSGRKGAAANPGAWNRREEDILLLANCTDLCEATPLNRDRIRMPQLSLKQGTLDRIAIGLSGLCAVHCVLTALFMGLLATFGHILESPLVHEVGLVMAIMIGAVALGLGALSHGFMMPAAMGALGLGIMTGSLTLPHGTAEMVWSLIGVTLLALGHDLNHRASH
jgi:hypothetical protein